MAREDTEYGYRRTTVQIREVYGYSINHKVVQKLHQERDLPLILNVKPPKPSGVRQAITVVGDRVSLLARREQIGPFARPGGQAREVAYADFTELAYTNGRRKAYLIPLVDHRAGPGGGRAVYAAGMGTSEADFDRVWREPAGVRRAS